MELSLNGDTLVMLIQQVISKIEKVTYMTKYFLLYSIFCSLVFANDSEKLIQKNKNEFKAYKNAQYNGFKAYQNGINQTHH